MSQDKSKTMLRHFKINGCIERAMLIPNKSFVLSDGAKSSLITGVNLNLFDARLAGQVNFFLLQIPATSPAVSAMCGRFCCASSGGTKIYAAGTSQSAQELIFKQEDFSAGHLSKNHQIRQMKYASIINELNVFQLNNGDPTKAVVAIQKIVTNSQQFKLSAQYALPLLMAKLTFEFGKINSLLDQYFAQRHNQDVFLVVVRNLMAATRAWNPIKSKIEGVSIKDNERMEYPINREALKESVILSRFMEIQSNIELSTAAFKEKIKNHHKVQP